MRATECLGAGQFLAGLLALPAERGTGLSPGHLYVSQGLDRRALRCYLRASQLDSPWQARARQAAAETLTRLSLHF